MMRGFWRSVPFYLSIAPAVILGLGFYSALRPGAGAPVPPPAAAPRLALPSGTFLVVALGDSLSRGHGDDTGRGYVGDVAALLKKDHPSLRLENLGVDGLESSGLVEMLDHTSVLALLSRANLVLVSIGGNDLSHAAMGNPLDTPERLTRARELCQKNLDVVLAQIRRRNPDAAVRILALYNPFNLPGGARRLGSGIILEWNAMISSTALAHGALAVPTFDLFENHPDRLSSDHFHPDEKGYALIARRIEEGL